MVSVTAQEKVLRGSDFMVRLRQLVGRIEGLRQLLEPPPLVVLKHLNSCLGEAEKAMGLRQRASLQKGRKRAPLMDAERGSLWLFTDGVREHMDGIRQGAGGCLTPALGKRCKTVDQWVGILRSGVRMESTMEELLRDAKAGAIAGKTRGDALGVAVRKSVSWLKHAEAHGGVPGNHWSSEHIGGNHQAGTRSGEDGALTPTTCH